MTDFAPGELWPTVKCKGCGAPMKWITGQESGKKIPLDPLPIAGGNIRIENSVIGQVAIYDRGGDGPHYISHFATCTKADRFRRK